MAASTRKARVGKENGNRATRALQAARAPLRKTCRQGWWQGDARSTLLSTCEEERFSFGAAERNDVVRRNSTWIDEFVKGFPTLWLLTSDINVPCEDSLPSEGDCAAVIAAGKRWSTDVAPGNLSDVSLWRCKP